jgi:hypothetical protein
MLLKLDIMLLLDGYICLTCFCSTDADGLMLVLSIREILIKQAAQ